MYFLTLLIGGQFLYNGLSLMLTEHHAGGIEYVFQGLIRFNPFDLMKDRPHAMPYGIFLCKYFFLIQQNLFKSSNFVQFIFIFPEELLSQNNAIWVSPDSTQLAYVQFNDSGVSEVAESYPCKIKA